MSREPPELLTTDLIPRPARAEDVPGIIALVGEIFEEYGFTLNVEADEPRLLEAHTWCRSSGGGFWVVPIDGVVRATAAVFLHAGAGELKSLYVHPSLRRRGLGRRLVEMAMQRARESGRPRMILWSDTRLRDAHRLYRNMGFRQHGVRMLFDTQDSVELGFEMEFAAADE